MQTLATIANNGTNKAPSLASYKTGMPPLGDRGHAQYAPIHLAATLLEDLKDLFRKTLSGAGDGAVAAVERVFNQALKKIPSQSPAPDELLANSALIKIIRKAHALQKKRGDTHLHVDQLIMALLEDLQIGVYFKEAGLSAAVVRGQLDKVRGGDKKVKNSSRDTNYQALKKYGQDLVIGRDEEIRRVIRVLSRRTKNNPVLIGEPRVGKTAVVEGIAHCIVRGDVPNNLANVCLVALDKGALIAGAKYKGEFEEHLKSVVKEVKDAEGKVILFIDEIHLVLGALCKSLTNRVQFGLETSIITLNCNRYSNTCTQLSGGCV